MEDKEDWFQLLEVCKLLQESFSNILPAWSIVRKGELIDVLNFDNA